MNYSQKYLDYLNSEIWKERRLSKLEQANRRCQKCGEREGLQVHHLNYDRLGNERSDDLAVLCKSCHWVADELRKNPGRLGAFSRGYRANLDINAKTNMESEMTVMISRFTREHWKIGVLKKALRTINNNYGHPLNTRRVHQIARNRSFLRKSRHNTEA